RPLSGAKAPRARRAAERSGPGEEAPRRSAASRRGTEARAPAVPGVLVDSAGVLADPEPLHWAAYREVLLELGVDVGIEEYRRRFISPGGGPEYACEPYRLPLTADELRARKLPRYLALLRRGVPPRPGARA